MNGLAPSFGVPVWGTGGYQVALDNRYLERHGKQWRVQMKVPEKVRHIVGKSKLVQALHTESLGEANKGRWPVVAQFRQMIADAEAKLAGLSSPSTDPLVAEAMFYRSEYGKAQDDPEGYAADFDHHGDLRADGTQVIREFIGDRTLEIRSKEGRQRADLFYGVATGDETPLVLLLDEWLDEKQIKPRQKLDYRRAVVKLDSYLRTNRINSAVQPITRRRAGDYVQSLTRAVIHWKTINKDVSALSSYWRWLVKRGHAEQNVWLGQGVERRKTSKSEAKRAFSDDEVSRLLSVDAPQFLRDAIWIAAFSGMRVDEIAKLRVGDTVEGRFNIHQSKTKAGERVVPIHPCIRELVAGRCEKKVPNDFLFTELPDPLPGSAIERSQKISKRFTALRRTMGIDDRVSGQRQARADFHSFRRWFITKAEMAGIPPHIISAVVGHARQGMTLGTYSGGPSFEQMRSCVEAVKIPAHGRDDTV